LSAGLDFETKLFAKTNAAALLRTALSKPGYQPASIALGANTDPYQPIEKTHTITRSVLEVLEAFNHPVGITTKSALVVRDIDILSRMAAKGLVRVFMSIGTLDREVARTLEPRASTPSRRMDALRTLSAAGIPTGVVVAPIIPALTDRDIEQVVRLASEAGADFAGYVMLRLPLEVRDLFVAWLEAHYPMRARHVMSLVEQVRDGKHNDATFGQRMRGTGHHATLIAQRMTLACQRFHMNRERKPLRTDLFAVPPEYAAANNARKLGISPQLDLF
jgi:DNA repair photolyase